VDTLVWKEYEWMDWERKHRDIDGFVLERLQGMVGIDRIAECCDRDIGIDDLSGMFRDMNVMDRVNEDGSMFCWALLDF
jgi:hypothetical protein